MSSDQNPRLVFYFATSLKHNGTAAAEKQRGNTTYLGRHPHTKEKGDQVEKGGKALKLHMAVHATRGCEEKGGTRYHPMEGKPGDACCVGCWTPFKRSPVPVLPYIVSENHE